MVNYAHATLCETCWQDLQLQAPAGRLPVNPEVRWAVVVPCLSALTVLGALAWGFLQQPDRVDRLGSAVYGIPLAWAFFLTWAMASVSGGVSRLLRVALCGSVLLSVLAGNIWGYRSFAIQQMEKRVGQPVEGLNLTESVRFYFDGLPQIWQGEAPFFLGGFFGAWIGLRYLKSQETIRLQ